MLLPSLWDSEKISSFLVICNTLDWKGQRPPTSSVLTFSAELALLLASAAAGRALARALVLALPASNQHFPQLPSQRLEGSVIGRENGAGVCRAAVRTAHIHKPQLARSHAGRIVWCCGCIITTDARRTAARSRRLVASSIIDDRDAFRLYRRANSPARPRKCLANAT